MAHFNAVVSPRNALNTVYTAALLALAVGCTVVENDDGQADTEMGGTEAGSDDAMDTETPTAPDGDGADDGDGDGDTGGTQDSGDDSGETTSGSEDDDGSDESTDTGEPNEPGPDLREAGPWAVTQDSDTASLPTGCSMGYDRYAPAGIDDAPVVILAHGFQGNRGTMAGWAEHWASWGMEVIAPDLCHSTVFDSDHAQNGVDLNALVEQLDLGSVVYSGYSAGGLAAVLAAAADEQALAVLGLDMVDADGLGAAVSAGLTTPAFAIIGEPSQCNTENNGLGVFQSAGGQVLRVTEADHCDFQSPADLLCGLACTGSNAQFDDESIQTAIRGLSTAAVVWQTGAEPTGDQWWTPGLHYYQLLLDVGILQAP